MIRSVQNISSLDSVDASAGKASLVRSREICHCSPLGSKRGRQADRKIPQIEGTSPIYDPGNPATLN
jgi:hypothetical protein